MLSLLVQLLFNLYLLTTYLWLVHSLWLLVWYRLIWHLLWSLIGLIRTVVLEDTKILSIRLFLGTVRSLLLLLFDRFLHLDMNRLVGVLRVLDVVIELIERRKQR